VSEWMPLFFRPDDVVEFRFLNVGRPGRTHAGWVEAKDIPKCAGAIAGIAADSEGSYFTPQRLDRGLLSRSKPGHFGNVRRDAGGKIVPELTTDADVIERRYLLVDIDPVRPSGVCSTDAEKSAARDVAGAAMLVLDMAAPLVVDSGNGFHLYYRLPEPLPGGHADASKDLIALLLACLAAKVDTDGAKVDTKVYNASRIMKIPGTWARKGKNTKERPHRQSRVIDIPSNWSA